MGCAACAGLIKDLAGEETFVRLRLQEASALPLEADAIRPDLFATLDNDQIKALPAYRGRRQTTLGELFEIRGEYSDSVLVEGDLGRVKRLGEGMAGGRLEVRGTVGAHLGAGMLGGDILVAGDAGDYAGAHMQGGVIRILGNAGHRVGGAYPGHPKGMNRGTIIIDGQAGIEAGSNMRRGLVVVRGDVGDFAGVGMISGTLLVFGRLGRRTGAGNNRGSIVAFGEAPEMLPTYRLACAYTPVYLGYFLTWLRRFGLDLPKGLEKSRYRRYLGDFNVQAKGEILVRDPT